MKRKILSVTMLLITLLTATLGAVAHSVEGAEGKAAVGQIASYGRRINARNYSDAYATNHNQNYKYFNDADCTNFMSQALHHGGYGKQYGWPQWYMHWDNWRGWRYSHTWTVTEDLKWLLWVRGWGNWAGWQNKYSSTNNAWYGDILVYDWTGDGRWDHMAMEADYYGMDQGSAWWGDLVNQHSTDRYRAIWHLRPYNHYFYTTKIGLIRVYY